MGGNSGRKTYVPVLDRHRSRNEAAVLVEAQARKRLATLERLLDAFALTLSVSPDEVVARDTPPTTREEDTAFSLSVAKSHIARAQTALARGDAGRAVESAVIAASFTASILDRRAQQRLLSSFGGKQTPYTELKLTAIRRARRGGEGLGVMEGGSRISYRRSTRGESRLHGHLGTSECH